MTPLAGMQQFLSQDLWRIDSSALSLPRRIGMHGLAIAVAMEFRHRLLDARAAALVYTTLLSLVPFLFIDNHLQVLHMAYHQWKTKHKTD